MFSHDIRNVVRKSHNYLSRMLQLARTQRGSQRSRRFVMPRGLKPAARVRLLVAAVMKHDTKRVCVRRAPVAWRRSALAAVLTLATVHIVGCGRPRGVLFPALDRPQVWPAPPSTPRVKLVGMLRDSGDLKAALSGREAFASALRGPRPAIRFLSPHTIAVGRTSLLAVADTGASAVHIIDLERRTHTRVTGFGAERFAAPVGVAWAGDRLFVTDAKRGEVVELDAVGGYVRHFGGAVLRRPVGIAFAGGRNELYVVDGDAHVVVRFNLNGRHVGTIGRRGSAPGEFNYPSHLCIRGDRLLVSDSGNFRVQLLDLEGRPIRTIGRIGDGAGDFSLPKGVAFDSEGHIYVVDAQFENVQVFDSAGRLLMAFGREGTDPGAFWLPSGLTIDHEDRIWVADTGNRRVQLFSYLRAPP